MAKKQLVPKEAAEVLTEDSVSTIEQAIKDKVELQVEAALTEQDDLYAERLQELVTAIDKDHTSKLNRVVEAVDYNNAGKLVKVIKRYENGINHKANGFKNTLVESISDYLEEYVDETIPAKAILEATQNRTAKEVLANLRKVLAVDSTLMSESVKEAVVDGKSQINDLDQKVTKLEKENKQLREAYTTTKADLILESKTAHLPVRKKST